MRIFGRGDRKKIEGYPIGFWYKNPWDRYQDKSLETEGFCQGGGDLLLKSHNNKIPLVLDPIATPEFHGEGGISPKAAPKISYLDYLSFGEKKPESEEKGVIDIENISLDEFGEDKASKKEDYQLNIIPISAVEIEGRQPQIKEESSHLYMFGEEIQIDIPSDFLGKLYLACETSYQENAEEVKEIIGFNSTVIRYIETLLDAYFHKNYKRVHKTNKIGIKSIVRAGRLAEGILNLSEEAKEYIRLLIDYKDITDKKTLLQAGTNFDLLLNTKCFYKEAFYFSIMKNIIVLSMSQEEFKKEITALNNIHLLIGEQIFLEQALKYLKEGFLPSQIIKKYLELQERNTITKNEVIIVLQHRANQESSQI